MSGWETAGLIAFAAAWYGIREDYLHERGRVDQLITALIDGGPR